MEEDIENLVNKLILKDKIINLMACDLETPIHNKNWIKNYYKEKALGIWDVDNHIPHVD